MDETVVEDTRRKGGEPAEIVISTYDDTVDDGFIYGFDPDDNDLGFEAEEFQMDDAKITLRNGDIDYPYKGQSIWLSPYPASAEALEAATWIASDDGTQRASSIGMLRKVLADYVVGHNLCEPATKREWPQWYGDPDAVKESHIPAETLFDLWSVIVNGELPEARPLGSTNGRNGTNTRASIRGATRGTKSARPRRASGRR